MRSGHSGWAVRLAGVGCAIVLAAAGVTAYLLADGGGQDSPLPGRVLGTQAIALVSPGQHGPGSWDGTGLAPAALLTSLGDRLTFSPGVQPGAAWIADQMQGGTYIFIYLADGLCLSSPAPPTAAAVLQGCNLSASQRWTRQALTSGGGGIDYYQLRNVGDSQCLGAAGPGGQAAAMQPCQAVPDWHQLITFVQPA